MQRLRSSWLALMGGAILVTLSVSAAFGANPSSTTDGPRGQTVASFVHEVVFGADEETDEDPLEEETEEETDETPELDEQESEETADLEGDAEVTVLTGTHGECVSAIARQHELVGEPNDNHGGAVSEAAHTCAGGAEALDEDLVEADPDETADEASAQEERKAEQAAARAERDAARVAARAERDAATDANPNRGSTHGRGGGRP